MEEGRQWIILLTMASSPYTRIPRLYKGFFVKYKTYSQVVELLDSSISQLYNSDTLWVVQFYSHWCGHCQRFAPFWKDLAKSSSGQFIIEKNKRTKSFFEAWSPIVKFAAMNCADQSCDKYQAGDSGLHSFVLHCDFADSRNTNY